MSQSPARRTLVRSLTLTLGVSLAVLLVACSRAPEPEDDGQIRVLVSIPPLAGLVEAMLPDGSVVETLIPPGSSVHSYQLRPDDRARVARADLVVMVGLGLEGRASSLLESAGDRLVRFDEAVGINDSQARPGHSHGPDCDHGHTIDPHLWLDPELVHELIVALYERLGALPEIDQEALRARSEALAIQVRTLDIKYRERLKPLRESSIVTHHNAWSRIADRYGLRVVAVLRPLASGEPTPAELARAREAIEREGVGAIFVEPQFDAALAQRLAKNAGVSVASLDPIGSGDWFEMMRKNLDVLVEGLSASDPAPETAPGSDSQGP